MKTIFQRSLISGLFILVGQSIGTLATVWGTDQFVPVLMIQSGAVLVGVGELLRRQKQDPVDSVKPPEDPPTNP
jgi:hypothetical protein